MGGKIEPQSKVETLFGTLHLLSKYGILAKMDTEENLKRTENTIDVEKGRQRRHENAATWLEPENKFQVNEPETAPESRAGRDAENKKIRRSLAQSKTVLNALGASGAERPGGLGASGAETSKTLGGV